MKKILLVLLIVMFFAEEAEAQRRKKNSSNNTTSYNSKLYDGMQWRNIGPFRGGRSAAVTGVPGKPNLFYFGAAGGGVGFGDPGNHLCGYVEYFCLVPEVVPHVLDEHNVFFLLTQGALLEEIENSHRVNQLVYSTLNCQERTLVVFEGLLAPFHCVKEKVH